MSGGGGRWCFGSSGNKGHTVRPSDAGPRSQVLQAALDVVLEGGLRVRGG